jgi:CBS domain-containing protein
MLVRDILNLKGGAIHSIEGSRTLPEAVALMVRLDIGSLVVVESGAMKGMLTFREVLRALDHCGGELAALRISDVMDSDPVCGEPTDTIDELRAVMTRHHIRYLPVKDGSRLVGVVSFHDVAKAVIRETSMENRLLKRYIAHQPATLEREP